jgi:signal peptidase II
LKRSHLAIGLILLVLLIDQSLKIWVKLNMEMGEHFNVFGEGQNWFQIFFTENPGMAFGFEFGGDYGKLALSLFRILAVSFITYYLYILIRQKKSYGLITSIALIWAGAVGNILDSAFYGLLFTNSHHAGGLASWATSGDGYADFLHGRVVDMLYFPLVEGHYPQWFPFVGGKHFQFFQPIFNVADTSISVGVLLIIIFYQRFFNDLTGTKKKKDDTLDHELEHTKVNEEEMTKLTDEEVTENGAKITVKTTVEVSIEGEQENSNSEEETLPDPTLGEHLDKNKGLDIPLDEEKF